MINCTVNGIECKKCKLPGVGTFYHTYIIKISDTSDYIYPCGKTIPPEDLTYIKLIYCNSIHSLDNRVYLLLG